jgi:hypothetical protein
VEFCSRQNSKDHLTGTWTTIINSRIEMDFTKKFFQEFFNQEYYYARYLRVIITLQQTLKSWQMPYLMFEGLSGNPHDKLMDIKRIKPLFNQIEPHNWLHFAQENFDTMTDHTQRLPCGHPNAQAHEEMANVLYNHIINNYASE